MPNSGGASEPNNDTGCTSSPSTPRPPTPPARGTDRVSLPTAAVTRLLVGPGTSIPSRALSTFARHGTTVVCVGAGAVRCYAGITADSQSTYWLERQVRAWSNVHQRLRV